MKINRRLHLQLLAQNAMFVALLAGIVAAVLYVTRDVRIQWDLTQARRNTLSEASAQVLARMKGPVDITAFATRQDTEGDLRKSIQEFVAPYQRVKRDVSLTFVDPREEPKRAQEAGVRLNGELVVRYNGRSENLSSLTEQDLTNLLLRLVRSSERLVVYLDGHGERKLDGHTNQDLGDFGAQLTSKGFKIGSVNLAVAQDLPANASVIVIAGPRVNLLPGEVNRIKQYLDRGGNLLWLADSDSLRGMSPVAELLGLNLIDGVVLDPRAASLNLPATFALASAYGAHRITEHSTVTSVFPYARRIAAQPGGKFRFTPLVEAAPQGWLETGALNGASFDPKRDVRGPIVVAGALERDIGDRKQRVVVVGTSQFLAGQFVGLLGNLDLGVNIVNWLAGDENLITVQPRTRTDLSLEMSRTGLTLIVLFFLVALPLGLLISGGTIWWRRRKS